MPYFEGRSLIWTDPTHHIKIAGHIAGYIKLVINIPWSIQLASKTPCLNMFKSDVRVKPDVRPNLRPRQCYTYLGVFHTWGTPIAGWFLLGKIPSRNG